MECRSIEINFIRSKSFLKTQILLECPHKIEKFIKFYHYSSCWILPKNVVKMGNIWKSDEKCIFCDFFKDTSRKFTNLEWGQKKYRNTFSFEEILFKCPHFSRMNKKIENLSSFTLFHPVEIYPKIWSKWEISGKLIKKRYFCDNFKDTWGNFTKLI